MFATSKTNKELMSEIYRELFPNQENIGNLVNGKELKCESKGMNTIWGPQVCEEIPGFLVITETQNKNYGNYGMNLEVVSVVEK